MLTGGMRRRFYPLTVAVCLLALASALAAIDSAQAGSSEDRRHEARLLLHDRAQASGARSRPSTRLLATSAMKDVVVGLRDNADQARVAATLRSAGASVRLMPTLVALAVGDVSPATVMHLLRGDASVAYIEEDRELRQLADPFDAIDPESGLNYSWAYDAIAAEAGIAAAGGGSPFLVAVIDTGVDVSHPDLAGRIAGSYSTLDGGANVTDELGHGTFVAGLISAIDGNGVGGKGAAGATSLLAVKASSPGGEFYESQLADAIVWGVESGARIVNLSLGGRCPSGELVTRALDYAFAQGVLIVAAAGNNAEIDNARNCPAADLGGTRGGWGSGLSVGATDPSGQPTSFSTFNDNVSIAAPGGGNGDCRHGVFSTLPTAQSLWDNSCAEIFALSGTAPGRWAYGQGTSFAAPLVSAVAALALHANPNLYPEQLAEVLKRSAVQTLGEGWNARTGNGVVNAAGAVDLARRFDSLEPRVALRVAPRARRLRVTLNAVDAARDGEDPAHGTTAILQRSRDGISFEEWIPERSGSLDRRLRASRTGPAYWFRAVVCDANKNCVAETVGPKRPTRVKPIVKLRTRLLPDGKHRAIVTLRRVKGLRGRATVVLDRRTNGRFRAIGRFRMPFGKSLRRTFEIPAGETVQLRARVKKAPDWRSVRTRAVSVAATHR